MASTSAVSSLSAKTTGDGATVDFLTAKRNVTMVVTTSGTISVGAVIMQASQDGTNWATRCTVMADGPRTVSVDNTTGAYRYWRASVARDVAGGGSVTATFMESD